VRIKLKYVNGFANRIARTIVCALLPAPWNQSDPATGFAGLGRIHGGLLCGTCCDAR
jgi:hypothetical protein